MPNKIELELAWENDNYFEMTAKPDDGEPTIILRMDENTHLPSLWHNVTKICASYLEKVLKDIGKEMAQ